MKFASLPVLLVAVFILTACSKKEDSSAAGGVDGVDYYTCTMHPSVRSKDPDAKCPICSMDLVPVMKQDAAAPAGGHAGHAPAADAAPPKSGEFTVPVERQQMIGVRYASVQERPLETTLRTVGVIEPDAGLMWEYVSRVDGYVQELLVNSAGRKVVRGQPLLTIYSPDLLTTGQEFIELLRSRDGAASDAMRRSTGRMIESAKRRLRLWNVGDEEIAAIEKTRKASELLMLRSPFDGIVAMVPARQGMSVKVGDPLISIIDLSTVWVWADFFENELPLLATGRRITVTAPAFGDQAFDGEIAVIDPMIDSTKRTARVRIDIPNPNWTLRPGMFVNALLDVQAGVGLTVPASAVMPTGNRNLVFVDKGEGRLDPRFVRLGRKFSQPGGPQAGDYYEVLGGLSAGDRVVASANFLIDAEAKIQGVLKTWEADGGANGANGANGGVGERENGRGKQ